MTPTLSGRIQSRVVLVALVGGLIAFALGPVLSRPSPTTTLIDMYRVFFTALLIVGTIGIAWECLYHGLQQLRWEKDWPTLFGLVTGVPEGVLAYALLDAGVPWDVGGVPLATFLPMFSIVWICVWLVANGPLQIIALRWRYRGGRFI